MQTARYLLSILLLSNIYNVTSKSHTTIQTSSQPVAAFGITSLPEEVTSSAKARVLQTAQKLYTNSKTGILITAPSSQKELKKVVSELEAICGLPTDDDRKLMLGDWKLLCMTSTTSRRKKKPSFVVPSTPQPPEFLKETQEKVRDSVQLVQRIRSVSGGQKKNETNVRESNMTSPVINRVDNVLEFTPLSLGDLPFYLNANPLKVSKAKVTVQNKAKVQSVAPVLKTKISLQSVLLTVAGTSHYLEPKGNDILGINVPFGEFLNIGPFDTTYVDDDILICREKMGLVEQLRVFTRRSYGEEEEEEGEDMSKDESVRERRSIGSVIEDNLESVSDRIESVSDRIESIIEKSVESVDERVDSIIGKSIKSVGERIESAGESIESIGDRIESVGEDIKTYGDKSTESVEESTKSSFGETDKYLAEESTGSDKKRKPISESIESVIEEGIESVSEGIESVVEESTESVGESIESFGESIESAGEDIKSLGEKSGKSVKESTKPSVGKSDESSAGKSTDAAAKKRKSWGATSYLDDL